VESGPGRKKGISSRGSPKVEGTKTRRSKEEGKGEHLQERNNNSLLTTSRRGTGCRKSETRNKVKKGGC